MTIYVEPCALGLSGVCCSEGVQWRFYGATVASLVRKFARWRGCKPHEIRVVRLSP